MAIPSPVNWQGFKIDLNESLAHPQAELGLYTTYQRAAANHAQVALAEREGLQGLLAATTLHLVCLFHCGLANLSLQI